MQAKGVPQVQGNPAAAPVAQAAPQPAFTLGPGRDNQVLDFMDVSTKKYYYKAIAPTNKTFNGSHEKFMAYRESLKGSTNLDGCKS